MHTTLKRAYLRLFPYCLPDNQVTFEQASSRFYLASARASLLAICQPLARDKALNLPAGVSLMQTNEFASPKYSGKSINPGFCQKLALEGIVMPFAFSHEKEGNPVPLALLEKDIGKILDATDLAPSDVSEAHGDFFSTLPENLATDIAGIEAGADLWSRQLFSFGELNHSCYRCWVAFRDHWGQSSWSFWHEWYQGFLDGKPLDWELQRRVALIRTKIGRWGRSILPRRSRKSGGSSMELPKRRIAMRLWNHNPWTHSAIPSNFGGAIGECRADD